MKTLAPLSLLKDELPGVIRHCMLQFAWPRPSEGTRGKLRKHLLLESCSMRMDIKCRCQTWSKPKCRQVSGVNVGLERWSMSIRQLVGKSHGEVEHGSPMIFMVRGDVNATQEVQAATGH